MAPRPLPEDRVARRAGFVVRMVAVVRMGLGVALVGVAKTSGSGVMRMHERAHALGIERPVPQLFFSCSDSAADNNECHPPCMVGVQGNTVNAACNYSCHGVLDGLRLNNWPLGFCLMPGDVWPGRDNGTQRSLLLPFDRTSVIQGVRYSGDEWQTHQATQLDARINAHWASLVLRHVAMQGLHAEQQRTSMWYKAGGAVYLYQSNITVHNSIFKNNYGVWGGAIAMQDAKPSEIIGCSFIFNSAFDPKTRAAHGGAILVLDSEQVSISASKFVSNTALSGGALLVEGSRSIQVDSSVFVGNSAKNYGGAVEVSYTNVNKFQGCSFVKNEVGKAGGGAAVRFVLDEWLITAVMGNCLGSGNVADADSGEEDADPSVVTWQSRVGSNEVRTGSLKRSDIAFGNIWPQLAIEPTSRLGCQAQALLETMSATGVLPGTCATNSSMPNNGRCEPACPTASLNKAAVTCDFGKLVWNSTCASSTCDAVVPAVSDPCQNDGKCWVYDVAQERIQGSIWVANPVISGRQVACECGPRWTGLLCETPAVCETDLGPRCRNGGACSADPGGTDFKCACRSGWTGPTCELNYTQDMFPQLSPLNIVLGVSVLCGLAVLPIAIGRHRQRLQQLTNRCQWDRQAAYPEVDGYTDATMQFDTASIRQPESAGEGSCRSASWRRLQAGICCAQGVASLLSGGCLCLSLAAHGNMTILFYSAASTYVATTVTTVYLGHRSLKYIAEIEGNHVQHEWWSSHSISAGLLLIVSANCFELLHTIPQVLCRRGRCFPFEPPHIWVLQHAGLYRHFSADVPLLLVAAAIIMNNAGDEETVAREQNGDDRSVTTCATFTMVTTCSSLLSGLLALLQRCYLRWKRRAFLTSSLQSLQESGGEYYEGANLAIEGPNSPQN